MDLWWQIPGWTDLLDILLVAGMVWLVIQAIRRTRARAALGGLAVLAVIYIVARSVGLPLTTMLLQGFFAVVVIVLVVLFQEDLRRAFEQLGTWRIGAEGQAHAETEAMDALVRSVARLATTRTGALIVLPGRESIERHVEGGVEMGGRLSEPLLLSIFDSSSPGHDGAVIVRGSTIERFAVHLPLSSNHAALGPGGTRHAAGLGLSERCDAACIIVSEERGTISVARGGELHVIPGAESLASELRSSDASETTPARRGLRRELGEVLLALLGALALWLGFVPGSETGTVRVPAPIEVSNLPAEFELESVTPERVEVTLRGHRRDLVLLDPEEVTIVIDAYLARLGRRTFAVAPTDVRVPANLSVVELDPLKVRISVRSMAPEAPPAASPAP